MRATIKDVDVLKSIKPLEIKGYLRMKKWILREEESNNASYWVKGEKYELLVPRIDAISDYIHRISDILKVLEVEENRSQLEILTDLKNTFADILRIKPEIAMIENGSIPIEYGFKLVRRSRDLMLASACATVEKKKHFPTRYPLKVTNFLNRVLLGQTERSSYVLTVITPVTPRIGEQTSIDEPFERQVTQTFAKAIKATLIGVDYYSDTGRIDRLEESIEEGASANLYEALSDIGKVESKDVAISFGITWSSERPLIEELDNRFHFPSISIPVLRESAEIFKEKSTYEEFKLIGPVIKLESQDLEKGGKVSVFGLVDEKYFKIQLELERDSHEKAIHAYKNGQIVKCLGRLIKDGRRYSLQEPSQFDILRE